ncbi:MAG: peptidoglycan DD-metalloendopeptidase family protein [Acidobacteria bacterium]|nr:peptidoglycan DD-metalloendopeptidase family protein [Acidobacteriota bacterium]MCB9397097.1 peptidoglycan DD-metalloendopeptidase family protein [Acidobacteriota bacterium]
MKVLSFLAYESVTVCVVFALVWFLTRLKPLSRSNLQCGLWSLVFVRLLIPPEWAIGLPAQWFARLQPTLNQALPVEVRGETLLSAGTLTPELTRNSESFIWQVLLLAWSIGVLFLLGRWFWRRAQYRMAIHNAFPLQNSEFQALVTHWTTHFGILRKVDVVVGHEPNFGPFTMGLVRPVVYLPYHVLGNKACFESVLAHEMAHVAAWDDLKISLQHLVSLFYFFHPLVWIANRFLSHQRELARDLAVLESGSVSAKQYGFGLLSALKGPTQAVGMAALGGSIPQRIRAIAHFRKGSRSNRFTFFLVLVLLVFPLCGFKPAEQSPAGSPSTQQVAVALLNPVPNARLSSGFGMRENPIYKKEMMHNGVDLVQKKGTAILAPADGVVLVAADSDPRWPGYGIVIQLDHGADTQTLFAHLGELKVKSGDTVKQGQVIATMGLSGKSTGVHVHFEVRVQGQPIDPLTQMSLE